MPQLSRLSAYGLLSTAAAAAVVGSALKNRPNFFAAAVSIGRSSGALMVIANFLLFGAICASMVFRKVFFGELRPIEYEHLFERLWIFLPESLLAFTIFRNDFTIPLLVMYGVLVFLKCFHWIAADRVDYIDQLPPPGPPLSFHIRLVTVTMFLDLADLFFLVYTMESILTHGISAMVLLASEFAILLVSMMVIWSRYVVSVMDLRRARGRADAPAWEDKSRYLFYIDLAGDLAKLLIYFVFVLVILLNYGLPLHILRDAYLTLRSFISRAGDFVRYRRATHNMDQLYPNATAEDLERMDDRTCIICREEMVAQETGNASREGPNETPKKLQCGHVFHFHCLRTWLERQQSCPTCRRDVFGHTSPPRQPAPAGLRVPPPGPAPAAPVPGAVPQPGEAAATPPPIQPTNDIVAQHIQDIHREFDRYFPRGGPNPNAPIPPTPTRPPPSAPSTETQNNGEGEERHIEHGLWGVPVTPGRFYSSIYGSAQGPSNGWPASVPVGSVGPSRPDSPAGFRYGVGTSTPQSSRPPEVFSSTSSPARRHTEARTSEEAEQPIEEDDDDAPAAAVDPAEMREAMMAAALKRFGDSGSRSLDKGKAPDRGPAEASSSGTSSTPALRPQGFDTPPTHPAFLTPRALPPPHPQVFPMGVAFPPSLTKAYSDTVASQAVPRTPEAARAALDQRITALRDVDSVMWTLVGELNRLKSAWEVEDGMATAAAQGNGGATSEATTELAPQAGNNVGAGSSGTSAAVAQTAAEMSNGATEAGAVPTGETEFAPKGETEAEPVPIGDTEAEVVPTGDAEGQ